MPNTNRQIPVITPIQKQIDSLSTELDNAIQAPSSPNIIEKIQQVLTTLFALVKEIPEIEPQIVAILIKTYDQEASLGKASDLWGTGYYRSNILQILIRYKNYPELLNLILDALRFQ